MMNNKNIPSLSQNIFHYATSELSQDAFISLLVAWFDSEEEELKCISKEFIAALYKVYHGKTLDITIKSIKIFQQHYKIDVYFEVTEDKGNIIPFIIEDKTWTEPHSDQLTRYVQKVSKKYPNKEIVKIFFKTGHITEKDQKETEEAKYSIIDSQWIYDFLSKYDEVDNIIFRHYTEFLTEEFYKKLYNEDATKKDLKDWHCNDVKEGYVQYAIIEKIKQLVQDSVDGTNDGYIRYIRNGKLWDTWWSFYVKEKEFSMFVKIKKIKKNYRLRLIRYALKNEHDSKGTEFKGYLNEILNKNTFIEETENPRNKAKETEIAFLELKDSISLDEATKVFSEFLIDFIGKLKKNN